jgi:hypothetical protein
MSGKKLQLELLPIAKWRAALNEKLWWQRARAVVLNVSLVSVGFYFVRRAMDARMSPILGGWLVLCIVASCFVIPHFMLAEARLEEARRNLANKEEEKNEKSTVSRS